MGPKSNKEVFSQIGILAAMLFMTTLLFRGPYPWIPLLDNANLLIHESGHIFFSGLGEYMGVLGGSLMQLITPLLFLLYFGYSRQWFGCGFVIYWIGENLINISVYVKDARTTLLPLVNEGVHDWNWLLTNMNMQKQDGVLGNMTATAGWIMILAGIGICGLIIYKEIQEKSKSY